MRLLIDYMYHIFSMNATTDIYSDNISDTYINES